MDKEMKAKWVEALRSGKYQQAKNKLRTNYGFCCLGVLCDLSDPAGWDGEWFQKDWHTALPNTLNEKYGLPQDQECTLASMNDKGASFTEIADYIEANL